MTSHKLITVINCLAALLLLQQANGLPQQPSTDPCEAAPCGKGAECKSMGSIAICVCPNDDKGDPFIACMKAVDQAEAASAPTSASVHHQQQSHQGSVSQVKTTPKPPSTPAPTTQRVALITSSTTQRPSPSGSGGGGSGSGSMTSTTTKSPYVHVFHTSSERPPAPHSNSDFGYNNNQNVPSSSNGNTGSHGDPNNIIPESHRIPIISNNDRSGGNSHYPQHTYPPRPIYGDLGTSNPTSSYYHHPSSSSTGGYNIFNEKTVGSSEYPGSYSYRPPTAHYSGSQSAYEYDSRPITHSTHHRFGQHSYHPTVSGFPAPITESSASRYSHSGPITSSASGGSSSSTYDIYNYNPLPNTISSSDPYSRIADPLGKYENCRMVNGIVVCADTANSFPYNHHQFHNQDPPRGDINPTPTSSYSSYAYHSSHDRNHYSSYYPINNRPTTPYYSHNSYNHRHGYLPDHTARYPEIETTESYNRPHHPYSFRPLEQKVSTQTLLKISSNPSQEPMCQKMCGINSICRLVLNRPVCGCPEDHTGDPSVACEPIVHSNSRGMRRDSGPQKCEKHVECKETEICSQTGECIDPCKHQDQIMGGGSNVNIARDSNNQYKTSICGDHAQCLVVGHTPVCKCNQGYSGNPYVACVP